MMPIRIVINVVIVGATTGLVTVAFYLLFDKYVFDPTFCKGATVVAERCATKLYFASTAAMIVGGLGALFALVRMGVFRPLLVIILATLALWNVLLQLSGLAWYSTTIASAALFGLAYAAFSWIVQIRNLYLALGLGSALVVAVRLMLIS